MRARLTRGSGLTRADRGLDNPHESGLTDLALRRRLGSALHEATRVLHLFARFAEQEGASRVTTDLARRWATHFPNLSPVSVHTRFQIVRRFAEWRHVTNPLTEIPPIDLLPARYHRKPPSLYQDADIDRLLEAARHLPSPMGLRGLTFSTLLGLLVVTGLRISEALALDDADVQRQDAQLMIRRSKFGKSRLVPLHASTLAALTDEAAAGQRTTEGGAHPTRVRVEIPWVAKRSMPWWRRPTRRRGSADGIACSWSWRFKPGSASPS